MKHRFSRASLVVASAVALVGCGGGPATVTPTPAPTVDTGPSTVVYEVEGDGTDLASITVATPDGTEQATVELPLRNKGGSIGVRYDYDPTTFWYISAQNENATGTVTCYIYVDGEQVSTATSSGPYAIATCKE